MVHRVAVSWLLTSISLGLAGIEARADDGYRAEIEQFRQRREAGLKAEDGWLSVVGLHWLRQGESKLGSDPASDMLLPSRAPAAVGTIDLSGRPRRLPRGPGVKVLRAGQAFPDGEIRSDAEGKPDVLAIDGIKLILLKRGSRYALRVKDSRSESRSCVRGPEVVPGRRELDHQGEVHPRTVEDQARFRHDRGRAGRVGKPRLRGLRAGGQDVQAAGRERARRLALAGLPRRHQRTDDRAAGPGS